MVWKMVPHRTSHALFKMTTVYLNTSFESCSPLVNDPPCSARTHAMSQPAAVANWLFCISLGSVVTFLRWSGKICSQLVSSFLSSLCTKNYWNCFIFDQVIPKIKGGHFLGTVYNINDTYIQNIVILFCLPTSTTHGVYLPQNDGLKSGESRQHRAIHFLVSNSKSSGPVMTSRGGRLPCITAVFICSSLIASNYPLDTQ